MRSNITLAPNCCLRRRNSKEQPISREEEKKCIAHGRATSSEKVCGPQAESLDASKMRI